MVETLTSLVTAHLLADFMLQWEWLIQRKRQIRYLALHSLIVAITAAIAIGAHSCQAAIAVVAITVTHFAMDYLKVRHLRDTLTAFLADQAVHLVIIGGVVGCAPNLSELGFWSGMPGDAQAYLYAAMTLLSGAIIAVPMGGILIKKLVADLAPLPVIASSVQSAQSQGQTTGVIAGMANGGKYIGWLERGLTYLLVLTGRIEGVGFLLAAKSILRLGDITDTTKRHQAEYIIIGTFMSFGWGLVVAFITAKVVGYWHV